MSNNNLNRSPEDRGWDEMSILLDQEMPQRRVLFYPWFWLLLFLLLGVGVVGYFNADSIFENAEVGTDVASAETYDSEDDALAVTSDDLNTQNVEDDENVFNPSKSEVSQVSQDKKFIASDHVNSEEVLHLFQTNESTFESHDESLTKDVSLTTNYSGNTEVGLFDHTAVWASLHKLSPLMIHPLNSDLKLPTVDIPFQSIPVISQSPHKSVPKYVQLQIDNDFYQNVGLALSGGVEYNLANKLSLQTGLAYTYDYVSANPRRTTYESDVIPVFTGGDFTSNEEFQEELTNYLNRSYSNDGNSEWVPLQGNENAFLRYGNLSQHLISLEQGITYEIVKFGQRSSLFAKAGGRLSYAFHTHSYSGLLITYPDVTSGIVNFDTSGSLVDDPNVTSFAPEWYYGLQAGLGMNLNEKWSLEATATTLRSLESQEDYLGLDEKRDLRITLGVRRYL